MNKWIYLRIEQGDLVELCTSLIRDLYGVEDVLLKYGGFKHHNQLQGKPDIEVLDFYEDQLRQETKRVSPYPGRR